MTIRSYLPKKIGSYSGIPVRNMRLFDLTDKNTYKPAVISQIRSEVCDGDVVVDIAAGLGIFSVVAAQSGAFVKSYDADPQRVRLARDTAKLSSEENRIEVSHAIVGEVIDDRVNSNGKVPTIEKIPECDLLILDVEGAEKQILEEISRSPETILVEVHPQHGVSVEQITDILKKNGYTIDSVAEMKTHSNYFVTSYLAE